ncbi:TetR/AcrR family transcriptional regulator [Brevibacillus laterosporus]
MQALKLFKEKGFENVTVEEITKACGIAKGTFYNYFPKKKPFYYI